MSMTDPVADLLTRIRNAQRAGLEEIDLPASNIKQRICEVLRDEGFVREVSRADDGKQGTLKVILKYDEGRRPAISEIRRQSKPGLRRYVKYTDIPKVMNGLGVAIVSTSRGDVNNGAWHRYSLLFTHPPVVLAGSGHERSSLVLWATPFDGDE